MAEIHLICGFIGFGKTTLAKQLEKELPAIRFTHDELMLKTYGRNPDDFQTKYKIIDDTIRSQTIIEVQKGNNVILDYGFWNKNIRREYYEWASVICPKVYFHALICDVETARKRTITRTQNNPNELFISADIFNSLLNQYKPISEKEGYPTIYHYSNAK